MNKYLLFNDFIIETDYKRRTKQFYNKLREGLGMVKLEKIGFINKELTDEKLDFEMSLIEKIEYSENGRIDLIKGDNWTSVLNGNKKHSWIVIVK